MTNPLLSENPLPLFSQVQASDVKPAIAEILNNNRAKLKALLNPNTQGFSFETLVLPLEKFENDLNCAWSTVSHLNSVKDNPEFRKAYDAILPKITEYYSELGQNTELYQAFQNILQSKSFTELNHPQQKLVKNALRDFKLAGVSLSPDKKAIFKKLRQELSELENQFAHNVLDASNSWHLEVNLPEKLKGIPSSTVAAAKTLAEQKGFSGWLFSLDQATYYDVLSYAENRELRREIYLAYHSRASEVGPTAGRFDNGPIIEQILKKRQELSALLDFQNYAEYSIAPKMAKDTKQVVDFLLDLAHHSKVPGEKEMAELQDFAAKHFNIQAIEPWDIAFLSEKLCVEKHQVSQEELRPYFPLETALKGLFSITKELFSIRVTEEHNFDKWHDTVRLFSIYNEQNELLGQFFLDPFHREGKRSGAWCSTCRDRIRWPNGKIQIPVAYVVCNFAPPASDKPALLKHDDVLTLFHEFGHCIHHLLTKIDYASISGNNGVEWDAIELPSQLLENWCWEREAMKFISAHYETNDPLPDQKFEALYAAKNFHSAMQMLRQLEFSLFDFEIHKNPNVLSVEQVQAKLNEIRNNISVVPISPQNRFQNTFSHIFAGPYAAGYYSYKWAEVLSSDVFEAFEEAGIFNKSIGQKLKSTILEQGGSKDAMELFIAFRGREPKIDALLRHSGLS